MNQESASRSGVWQDRWQRMRAGARSSAPFVAGILATLLALLLYNVIIPKPHLLTTNDVNNTVAQALASATPPPAFSDRVYQIIQPSLVLIESKGAGSSDKAENSLGSGVVIDANGDILTALHVVSGTTGIQVLFADGTQSSAQVVNSQPDNDIAVLRADNPPSQLVPATLGNPNSVRVGDEAYVVGNPFGLYGTMTAGVISALGRSFQPPNSGKELKNLIQIDAAVNPGNSGGPLLNRDGEVIGIVDGILNPDGQDVFIGIGFAVPITSAASAVGAPVY